VVSTCLTLLNLFRCRVVGSNRTFEFERSHETQAATTISMAHTKTQRRLGRSPIWNLDHMNKHSVR